MTNIAFAQYEIAFGDKPRNMAKVEQLLAAAASIDLLVLPELAFTGYEFLDADEVARFAEPHHTGPTSDLLRRLSRQHNCVIVAGYPERSGDALYNSAMLADSGEIIANYRKIHLFNRENDLFTPGDAPPAVTNTSAGRIGIMICFDWFFPEVARSLALDGAQVIAHPSNLVLPWCQRAMFARSVENHIYTITANRIGLESRAGREMLFTGQSQILSVNGETLVQTGERDEIICKAQIRLSQADQKQLNPWNNLLGSRRPDLYKL